MDPTFVKTFDEYLTLLAADVQAYGRDQIKSRDDMDSLAIGFESPSGWYLVRVASIRAWAEGQALKHGSGEWSMSKGPIPGTVRFSRAGTNDQIAAMVRRALENARSGVVFS